MGLYRLSGRLLVRNSEAPLHSPAKLRVFAGATRNTTTISNPKDSLAALVESPHSLYASDGQVTTSQNHQLSGDCTAPSPRYLKNISARNRLSWSTTCLLLLRNAFQTFKQRISYPKGLRNPGSGTTHQYYGSSPLSKFPIMRHSFWFSIPILCLNDAAMERNRSIAGTKRLYSCRSAPWKTVSTVFNKSSSTGTQRDRKSTGSRISKSYSSQDRVLKINLPSQQVSSSLQPTNQPTSQFWSHRLYKDEDGKDLVIHYCKSLETTEKVAKLFLNDKLLGLDLEWKAQASASDSIQSNVSVIQFASQNRIALFQIARFMPGKTLEHLVSPTLKRILESSDVTKVGVTIKADCTRLRKYLGIDPHSIFELSHLHKLIKYCHVNPKLINKRPVSLNEQVEEHFGLPLEKDVDVRCSNWTGSLTYRQVHYAAADAYANYQLFQTMDAKRKALNPTPPLPAHAELNLPIRTVPEPEVSVDLESNGIETIDPVNNAEKPEGCSQSI